MLSIVPLTIFMSRRDTKELPGITGGLTGWLAVTVTHLKTPIWEWLGLMHGANYESHFK
jgi:hypothetical protein